MKTVCCMSPNLPWLVRSRFTFHRTRVTPEILHRCIEKLAAGWEPELTEVERLFERHRGNLRHALLECYDRAARQSEPAPWASAG